MSIPFTFAVFALALICEFEIPGADCFPVPRVEPVEPADPPALVVPPAEPDPPEPPADWFGLPAIVSVYDPALCLSGDPAGLINCDDDPGHFGSGIAVAPEWYMVAAACDRRLYFRTVTFAGIGSFQCVDTGGAIGVRWSPLFGRWVIAFDVMVDLVNEPAPGWAYSLNWNWSIATGAG